MSEESASWSYRVIEFTEPDGSKFRAIHEVHFGADGKPYAYSENPAVVMWDAKGQPKRETLESIGILARMQHALGKPALTPQDFPDGGVNRRAVPDLSGLEALANLWRNETNLHSHGVHCAECKTKRRCARDLIEKLATLRTKAEVWRPISEAPVDGRKLLLWWRLCKEPVTGCFCEDDDGRYGWRGDGDMCIPINQEDCTHFAPLPEPPK